MSENQYIPDGQLDIIFYHGGYPLWLYLQEVIGINIVDICARIAKDEPILKTDHGQLVARVVDLPHARTIDHTFNNDLIFLLNSINVVFESLKAGVEKDGVKLMAQFKFKLDADHNMYLVGVDSDQPVSERGIAIIKIDE